MLAEEAFRRRFDPINPRAEIDAIEIKRDDLILAVARLQIQCEHRLLHLAVEGAFGFEEQILGELLGQRRPALDDVSHHHILISGAHQADGVEPDMFTEAPVFDGDEGVGYEGGKLRDVHQHALGQAALRDKTPTVVQDGDVMRRTVDQKASHIGQVRKKTREKDRTEDHAPSHDQCHDIGPAATSARTLWRRRLATFGDRGDARAGTLIGWRLLARHTRPSKAEFSASEG